MGPTLAPVNLNDFVKKSAIFEGIYVGSLPQQAEVIEIAHKNKVCRTAMSYTAISSFYMLCIIMPILVLGDIVICIYAFSVYICSLYHFNNI